MLLGPPVLAIHGADGQQVEVAQLTEPQLPAFLRCRDQRYFFPYGASGSSYEHLLNRLKGELGFHHQQTALRWLLEQLESSEDLRALVLLLLEVSNH